MAALTQSRNTEERSGDFVEGGVAASTKIYQGALVAVDADGFFVPGSTATTLRGVGRAESEVDNSSGSDGDEIIRIKRSIFPFANSASTDEITRADIGSLCYIVDDQTVAKTDGTETRSVAGKVYDVDAKGVWVDFR